MPETKRQKLTITSTGETQEKPRRDGKGTFSLLNFKAKTEDGKELSYSALTKSLFGIIKQGETIDAEVVTEEKELPSGDTITNRRITQIFVAGQPVATKGVGQQGWRGRSPEEILAERQSIERQTSIKAAVEYLKDDQEHRYSAVDMLRVADLFYAWLQNKSVTVQPPSPLKESGGDKQPEPLVPETPAPDRNKRVYEIKTALTAQGTKTPSQIAEFLQKAGFAVLELAKLSTEEIIQLEDIIAGKEK